MLRIFATEGKEYRMSIEVAGKFDQRPFGSMLANEYILWDRKGNKGGERGFAITDKGREAYRQFETANILRKIANLHLTHYFDPTTKRAVVHPIRKTTAA